MYGWRGAADELVRAAVMIAFLPHQAWLSMDAIVRAVYRRKISRRQLLEWQTAEAAGAQLHRHMNTFRQMLVISGLAVILMMVLRAQGSFFAPTRFSWSSGWRLHWS